MRRFSLYATLVALACASLLYAAQVLTPLRLTTDGIYYLSFADQAARGDGVLAFYRQHFLLPKGYPLFLFILMKAGGFSSMTLVISNLLFFSAGLLLTFRTLLTLGFERTHSATLCLLMVLSFTCVKNVTLPMSDFLFFVLSAGAWWLMNHSGQMRWFAIAPAICAVEVRLAGLALFVPLAFLAWSSLANRRKLLIPIFIVLLLGLTIGIWAGGRYFVDYLRFVRSLGVFSIVKQSAVLHSRDFAELISNFPWARLPRWVRPEFLVFGAAALCLYLRGMFVLLRHSPLTFFYLLGYSIIILPWPFTDPRFWLPIMPFVFLAIHQSLSAAPWRALRTSVAAYIVLFGALGLVALGYSTWLTFSGPRFAYRYGDGKLRATYLAGCSRGGEDINRDASVLLRRYQWHCAEQQ